MVHRRCSRCSQSMLSRCRYSTLLYRFPDARVCLDPGQGLNGFEQLNRLCCTVSLSLLYTGPYLSALILLFEAQAQRRFSADELRELQRCTDKGVYLRPRCCVRAHTPQTRWPEASVQAPRRTCGHACVYEFVPACNL
jgi:hypothetical protein